MGSMTDITQELTRFVQCEAEATRSTFALHWSLPLAERIAQGRCIDQLDYASTKSDRFIVLQCKNGNHSDFREGDLVRLSRGDPTALLLSGNLHRVDDDRIWIEPQQPASAVRSELQNGSWVIDRSFLDLESFYRKAVDDLGQTARGRERILPLLAGEAAPRIDLQRLNEASEAVEGEDVNESQAEAIVQAVATDLCHLVQGPPGTGKTFVLAHVVQQRLARGERIFVTAGTHRAIHNALNMIRRVMPGLEEIVKIGPEIYDPELRVRQYETFDSSPLTQCEGGYVVGATPFTARSKRLRGVEFDTVIIDEAGQVTLPLAAMAMLAADTYILVGDHRQLPPVVQSLPPSRAHEASIFSRLSGQGFSTMLEITYRMNSTLAQWPAENFYSGKLRSAKRNAARLLALSQPPQNFQEVLSPAHPLVFLEMEHHGSRRYSDEEASLVANLLEELDRCGFPFNQIAVVVPFRRQARRIRYFLEAKPSMVKQLLSEVVIDTVERMQGQEREVVILSMTASEPGYLAGLLSFLLQPQRINVAVTRSRSKRSLSRASSSPWQIR
jgi:DNA replication ATP-dependent helicase Dna2